MCSVTNGAGFLNGFVDGAIAVFSVIANLFWSVTILEPCTGTGYVIGFIIGLLLFATLCFRFSLWALLIMAIILLASMLIANPLAVIIITLAIIAGWEYLRRHGSWQYIGRLTWIRIRIERD